MTDENGIRRKVKASYGIVNVLQLRHVSALKHRYPSIEFTSITVPKGRREQGTPRLGEGELASMMMQNMMLVKRLQEAGIAPVAALGRE